MDSGDNYMVKTFIYKNNYYAYDAFTNTLMRVNKEIYLDINEYINLGEKEYRKKYGMDYSKSTEMLLQKGYFKCNQITEVESPYNDMWEDILNNNVNNVTLQVTQECNFKCRYCSYATDNNISRTHLNANMSWEIAQKSIDFLYNHSSYANKVNISFYGGEPLLNFPLIKKAVHYANELFLTKTVQYVMTINGSIMSSDIMDFIVKNNFYLTISFDGDKQVQNKHRVFRKNGLGTFDVVYKNVSLLRENYPDYFAKNVLLLPVLFNDESDIDVKNFFVSCMNIPEDKIAITTAEMRGIDYRESFYVMNNNYNSSRGYFRDFETNIEFMDSCFADKYPINKKWHHRGPCIPGVQKLFVDIHGILYPCEKCIDDLGLAIGDVRIGFDKDQIFRYLNVGKLTENECKKCWATRFCDICALRCFDVETSTLKKETKLTACKLEKEKTLEYLKDCIDNNNKTIN